MCCLVAVYFLRFNQVFEPSSKIQTFQKHRMNTKQMAQTYRLVVLAGHRLCWRTLSQKHLKALWDSVKARSTSRKAGNFLVALVVTQIPARASKPNRGVGEGGNLDKPELSTQINSVDQHRSIQTCTSDATVTDPSWPIAAVGAYPRTRGQMSHSPK